MLFCIGWRNSRCVAKWMERYLVKVMMMMMSNTYWTLTTWRALLGIFYTCSHLIAATSSGYPSLMRKLRLWHWLTQLLCNGIRHGPKSPRLLSPSYKGTDWDSTREWWFDVSVKRMAVLPGYSWAHSSLGWRTIVRGVVKGILIHWVKRLGCRLRGEMRHVGEWLEQGLDK